MPVRINGMVIDCHNATTLARFWSAALNVEMRELHDGELAVVRAQPTGLCFQRVPERKIGKNRLHIDLALEPDTLVGTPEHDRLREQEVARLLSLGAAKLHDVRIDTPEHKETWTVMADPEGNEFCVGF